jgi:hypothetical protein
MAGGGIVIKSATLSECGTYRHWLQRDWDEGSIPIVFCMLNPSSADANIDDPTIRRCIGYAKRDRYGGLIVVNLFDFRATRPTDMKACADPSSPQNIDHLVRAMEIARFWKAPFVCAWGADAFARNAGYALAIRAFTLGLRLKCLGVTKDGSPRHPLYVKGDQPLVPWPEEVG